MGIEGRGRKRRGQTHTEIQKRPGLSSKCFTYVSSDTYRNFTDALYTTAKREGRRCPSVIKRNTCGILIQRDTLCSKNEQTIYNMDII